MTIDKREHLYVRFFQFCAAAPAKLPQLGPFEERLFQHVALAQYRDENLSVRELMSLRHFGAPATIPRA
jgi:hypothetical protein